MDGKRRTRGRTHPRCGRGPCGWRWLTGAGTTRRGRRDPLDRAAKIGCSVQRRGAPDPRLRRAERDQGLRDGDGMTGEARGRLKASERASREPRAAPSQRAPPEGLGLLRAGGARPPLEDPSASIDGHRAGQGVGRRRVGCRRSPRRPTARTPPGAGIRRGPRRDAGLQGEIVRGFRASFEVGGAGARGLAPAPPDLADLGADVIKDRASRRWQRYAPPGRPRSRDGRGSGLRTASPYEDLLTTVEALRIMIGTLGGLRTEHLGAPTSPIPRGLVPRADARCTWGGSDRVAALPPPRADLRHSPAKPEGGGIARQHDRSMPR